MKLIRPRDFRGDYCNTKVQWNDGLNLEGFPKMTYTMNVSAAVEHIAMQLVCSSKVERLLRTGPLLTASEMETYRCACCFSACSSCYGSLPLDDLTTSSGISSTIGGKMRDITGTSNAGSLFSTTGANGDYFSNMWQDATKYFNFVCLEKCNTPYKNNLSTSTYRTYRYSPAPDAGWKRAWEVLAAGSTSNAELAAVAATINTQFVFKSLPRNLCPYHERYCVPFPGVEFNEIEAGYCGFKMSKEVIESVGGAAAQTFEELGLNDLQTNAVAQVNNATGDLLESWDALLVVGIIAMIIGLIFIVCLRFFTGCIVWCSLFGVILFFGLAGLVLYIRSSQCVGASLFDSGKQMGTAVVLTGAAAMDGSTSNEEMSGDGKDYRGMQTHTRSGRLCQDWASDYPHSHRVNVSIAPYNTAGLEKNYCRNPLSAPTIWCYTSDPARKWEACTPLGVIRPHCPQGYAISSETWRKAMEVCAYIVWGFGVLWMVLIGCLCSRIRLAIGINKSAAMFLYHNPMVLNVPLIQITTSIIWTFIWVLCASFLLSQVPDDYVPKGSFQSYSEAHEKCLTKAIPGFIWKSEGDVNATSDPCSGNLGDTTGMTPRCWNCAPPRYIIDPRFGCSFFMFLWNKAFLIALGQTIIAGAVCIWFFAPREEKSKQRTVRQSIWVAFRYHTGSLAFGAFILAVVQFIRWLAYYFEKQAKAQHNQVMQYILKCAQCILWCIEKCIKFLNKNAYIQVAILGTSFCTSAKNAFQLITRNFARFGVLATLGSVIYLLGFVFIMVFTSVLGYFVLLGLHPDISPIVPVIMYVIVSYVAAKLYMNVFGLAVDTMLQCFIATEEMGGDSDFVPSPLRAFVKDMDQAKDDQASSRKLI